MQRSVSTNTQLLRNQPRNTPQQKQNYSRDRTHWGLDYFFREGENTLVHMSQQITLPSTYFQRMRPFQSIFFKDKPNSWKREGMIHTVKSEGLLLLTIDGIEMENYFPLPFEESPDEAEVRKPRVYTVDDCIGNIKVLASADHPFRLFTPYGELAGIFNRGPQFTTRSHDMRVIEQVASNLAKSGAYTRGFQPGGKYLISQ